MLRTTVWLRFSPWRTVSGSGPRVEAGVGVGVHQARRDPAAAKDTTPRRRPTGRVQRLADGRDPTRPDQRRRRAPARAPRASTTRASRRSRSVTPGLAPSDRCACCPSRRRTRPAPRRSAAARHAGARTATHPCRSSTPPAARGAPEPGSWPASLAHTTRSRPRSQVRPKSSLTDAWMPPGLERCEYTASSRSPPSEIGWQCWPAQARARPARSRSGHRASPSEMWTSMSRPSAGTCVQNMLTMRPSSGWVARRWSQ